MWRFILVSATLACVVAIDIHAKPDRGKPVDPPVQMAAPTIKRTGPARYSVTIPEWPHPILLEFETLRDQNGVTHPSLYQRE